MYCSPALFALCHELKAWGVEPSFEVGHLVARGFADLGSEEFVVVPGPKLVSLTAGGIKELPDEHRRFFYWIPSIEDCRKLLEGSGCGEVTCRRSEQRSWIVECTWGSGGVSTSSRVLHEALVQAVIEVRRSQTKAPREANG
jgi:hypothetical protein